MKIELLNENTNRIETLEDCNSDFFSSNLSRYFDYEKFHNDCDYDCYVGSNGYVII